MLDAGLNAFAARDERKTGVYSFEREHAKFPPYVQSFRANARAWAYFNAQADSDKRIATFWVTSAKQRIQTSDFRLQS